MEARKDIKPSYKLRLKDIEFGPILLVDDFSKWRQSFNRRIGTKYFVRVFPKELVLRFSLIPQLLTERKCFDTMHQLPYTVNYYGHSDDEFQFQQFFTFVAGGSLAKLILTVDDAAFNKFVAAQVFTFIDKCIDLEYVFRNISHANILIARDGQVRFINSLFGSKVTEDKKLSTLCGSLEYACPEMLTHKPYSHNADIWALGILLHWLTFLTTPFFDRDPLKVCENILAGRVSLSNIEDIKLRKLVDTCLNTKKRPSNNKDVQKMTKMKYWEGIRLNHIIKKKLPTPFQPMVKAEDDLNSFDIYPESSTKYNVLASNDDPFVMW